MMTIAYLFDIRSEASSSVTDDGSSAALPFTADTEIIHDTESFRRY